MRFWDTSAIIPLVAPEDTSTLMRSILREDDDIAVSWHAEVECVSALSRVFREKRVDRAEVEDILRNLGDLISGWSEVQPVDEIRVQAERLLFSYRLRAMDALHLGSALLWCEGKPAAADMVCLDRRLRVAARNEGFKILPSQEDLG